MTEQRLRGMDVLIQGRAVSRGVEVAVDGTEIRAAGIPVPIASIFWTSRRAGLLMIFAEGHTLAVQGPRPELERLVRALEPPAGARESGRGRLPPYLTAEVILCTAGVAVDGRVEGRRVRGLRVAVVTRGGLHLLHEGEDLSMRWPVEEARAVRTAGGQEALLLRKGEDALRLLYLFPEERRVALEAARGGSDRGDEGGAAGGASLELFGRREVAGPVPPVPPPLRFSVETLQEGAESEAGRIEAEFVRRAGFGPHFLETHFLELGEIAFGPLLLRKSAASSAGTLERAVEAMDAGELEEDTRAAVANAAERLIAVHEAELERLARARRAPRELRERHELDVEAREEVRVRLQAPFEKLVPLLRRLEERQEALLRVLQARDAGPPEGDDGRVQEARKRWGESLRELDEAFARAWREMVVEVRALWDERLLPGLARIGSLRRRRMPEWVSLVVLALITLLVAAAAMILLVW